MPSNTNYDPQNVNDFEKSKLNKNAHGVAVSVDLNSTTNIDFTLTDDSLVIGGTCIVVGAKAGDKVDFQVIHPIAGVLNQFVTDWYIDPGNTKQETPKSNYPAKLPAGLILRVIYYSTATIGTAPWIAVNYDIEKVLE